MHMHIEQPGRAERQGDLGVSVGYGRCVTEAGNTLLHLPFGPSPCKSHSGSGLAQSLFSETLLVPFLIPTNVVPWGGAFGFACYESKGWGFSGLTSLSDFRNCPSPFKRKKEKQGKDL